MTTKKLDFDADTLWVLEQLKKEGRGTDICLNKDTLFGLTNSAPSPRIQLKILNELKALGAISLQYSPIPLSDIGTARIYDSIGERFDKFVFITTLQPKFNEICRSKVLTADERQKVTKKSPELLTKDGGDYFYNGTRVDVNKKSLYYDVFDILYLGHDQDGYLSYAEIEALLIKRNRPEIADNEARNKRVRNAISGTQGFFKFAKVNGKTLKNLDLDGRELISKNGSGLRLNNSVISR